jgi:hypothetical protein
MRIQISCDSINAAIEVIAQLFFVSVCIAAVVLLWDSLKWTLLWMAGAKDFAELDARFKKQATEARERLIARGEPVTFGGILKLIGCRMWTAYRHPIRAWRGEFDRPKNDPRIDGKNP